MRLFGSDRISGFIARLGLDEDTPISAGILSGSIEGAQKRIEGQNFNRRKDVLTYDDVMNQQRTVIYDQRAQVLNGEDLSGTIRAMVEESIRENAAMYLSGETPAEWNLSALRGKYYGLLTDDESFQYSEEELATLQPEDITGSLCQKALALYEEKEALFGNDAFREVERVILLRNVDRHWMEHIDAMDELKGYVGLNSYAQRSPISEYRLQGADMFDEMVAAIREDTVRMILSVKPQPSPMQRVEVAKVTSAGHGGASGGVKPAPQRPQPVRTEKKVGRNDPCPCGSGKKYKNCCGANANAYKPGEDK